MVPPRSWSHVHLSYALIGGAVSAAMRKDAGAEMV